MAETPIASPTDLKIYSDVRNRAVIIQFGRKIEWLGLELNDAMAFRNAIDDKIKEVEKHIRRHPAPTLKIKSNEPSPNAH